MDDKCIPRNAGAVALEERGWDSFWSFTQYYPFLNPASGQGSSEETVDYIHASFAGPG
jgi:hypothetical protein